MMKIMVMLHILLDCFCLFLLVFAEPFEVDDSLLLNFHILMHRRIKFKFSELFFMTCAISIVVLILTSRDVKERGGWVLRGDFP